MSETPNTNGGPPMTVKLRPRADVGPVRGSEMLPVEAGHEDPKLHQSFDPLEELLSYDITKGLEAEVDMSPQFENKWRVKALSNDMNANLLERATRYRENPRTHEQVRELDNVEFTRLIVAYCVIEPNLQDPKLYAKFGVDRKRPDILVAKVLLPGHVDRIAGAIMRLSGFRDELVNVAKNSSNGEV